MSDFNHTPGLMCLQFCVIVFTAFVNTNEGRGSSVVRSLRCINQDHLRGPYTKLVYIQLVNSRQANLQIAVEIVRIVNDAVLLSDNTLALQCFVSVRGKACIYMDSFLQGKSYNCDN